MKQFLSKGALLVTGFIILSLIFTGCIKKKTTPISQQSNDSFSQILAEQSELKKFANSEEMKSFFEKRSPVNNYSSPMSGMMDSFNSAGRETMAPLASGSDNQKAEINFSGTNIQVAGVDESDIVKTDGEYIYSLKDQNIVIVKARPEVDMEVVATVLLDATPQELYIKENKLIVFGYNQGSIGKMPADSIIRPNFSGTFLSFYDITNPSSPILTRRLDFDGNYSSSRLIDNSLYFITANYNFYPLDNELPRVFENGQVISGQSNTDKYLYPSVYYINSGAGLNATTVSVFDLNDLQAPINSQVFLIPAGETIYASRQSLYIAYTKYISEYQLQMAVAREILAPLFSEKERQRIEQIEKIDTSILSEEEKLSKINQVIEGYINRLSNEEQKIMSENIQTEFNRRHPQVADELEKTVIHKISFSDQGLQYVASGEVTGRLLNQFSLDEYQGNLRLATTRSQRWFGPIFFAPATEAVVSNPPTDSINITNPVQPTDSINNVYVLDDSLRTIGRVENLAPGERIYSARFMGVRSYLVTFKQTDPLFVIDLSDPTQPAVLGQLKIPGFSNYLHPYDDTTLIGIGKEAIDKGSQGVDVLGIKISLFDVKNPVAPQELASVILGGRGSDSSALYDHKAVLFSKEKNLLVLPVSLTSKNNSDYQIDFQGSVVFNINESQLSERGRVAFRLPNQFNYQNDYIDDTVRRNLYIDNSLFSLSSASLKVSQLDTLSLIKNLDIHSYVKKDQNIISTPPATPFFELNELR